jgi:hypothetical protein
MKKRSSFFFALAAVLITVISVWHIQRPIKPTQNTWDDVMAEAKEGGYSIITTKELADRYQKDPSSIILVDTRQEWEYRTGHIKGAVNFPMEPTLWERWRKADDLKDFLGPDKECILVFY